MTGFVFSPSAVLQCQSQYRSITFHAPSPNLAPLSRLLAVSAYNHKVPEAGLCLDFMSRRPLSCAIVIGSDKTNSLGHTTHYKLWYLDNLCYCLRCLDSLHWLGHLIRLVRLADLIHLIVEDEGERSVVNGWQWSAFQISRFYVNEW